MSGRVSEYNKAHLPPEPEIIDFAENTDVGNARRFVHLHGRNIRYVADWKKWMVWNGKIWVMRDTEQMTPYVEEMTVNMRRKAETLDKALGDTMLRWVAVTETYNRMLACIRIAANQPKMPASPDDFDREKYLINFINGTLDLRTGQLREFRREDMMTKLSSIAFDPDAKCPLWLKFLDRIFESNEELIKYVQTIMGMCLTGDASQEQIFIFWGATGANGKGTLVETVGYILSDYMVALPIESLLSTNRYAIPNDIAMLKGARYCVVNEPDLGAQLSEGKIKKMTSKDSIPARFLNKEFFRFKPTHHTIIQTNTNPIVKSTDGGTWRRLVRIPFNVFIPPSERDLKLDVKLQAEASGILNWLLEGCLRWQKEGLIEPQIVTDSTLEYRAEMDRLGDFFNWYTLNDPQARTPHVFLYTVYKLWASSSDIPVMSEKAFTQVILERGYRKLATRDAHGRSYRGFAGIRVTDVLLQPVAEYFEAPDSEKQAKKEALLHMLQELSIPIYTHKYPDSHARQDNNCSMCSTCSPITEIAKTQCVASVACVAPYNDIIIKLKEEYDKISKPSSLEDSQRLKNSMDSYILSEFPDIDFDTSRIVDDYCRSRGWE